MAVLCPSFILCYPFGLPRFLSTASPQGVLSILARQRPTTSLGTSQQGNVLLIRLILFLHLIKEMLYLIRRLHLLYPTTARNHSESEICCINAGFQTLSSSTETCCPCVLLDRLRFPRRFPYHHGHEQPIRYPRSRRPLWKLRKMAREIRRSILPPYEISFDIRCLRPSTLVHNQHRRKQKLPSLSHSC